MMKILYVATVGGFMKFFKDLVRQLIDDGHVVDFAANQSSSKVPDYYSKWGCKIFDISCSRSPLSFGNIKAIKQIRNLAKEYDIVHCHTPIAAACTRLACKGLRKKGVKVIYTAHGFHFYKGAPKKNWLIYYPVEKICARWTDVLITINKEDYELAKKKLHAKKVEYVPGVGIDVDKFANTMVNRIQKRQEIGVPEDAFMLLSVGELNANKNHHIVIKALAEIGDPNIHYVIAGKGDKKDELEALAKELNVNLHLLGYRSDVAELYKVADLYILPSIREGLNVSVMEALSSGCPVVASKIRGNVDMISNDYCFNPFSIIEIVNLVNRSDIKNDIIVSNFGFASINKSILTIYENLTGKI